MIASTPKVQVWWGWQTREDQAEVEELFRDQGIDADPCVVTNPTGGEPGFIVEIVAAGAVASFFHGYFESAGQDAWQETKRLVQRLTAWFKTRYPNDPPADRCTLILRGSKGKTTVYLNSDLPDDAYVSLQAIDLRPGWMYRWNPTREEWLRRPWWGAVLVLRGWRKVKVRR